MIYYKSLMLCFQSMSGSYFILEWCLLLKQFVNLLWILVGFLRALDQVPWMCLCTNTSYYIVGTYAHQALKQLNRSVYHQ